MQGIAHSYTHHNGRIGVLVEVNCETDFVARTDEFKVFCHNIALQIAAMAPESVEELLAQSSVVDASKSVSDLLVDLKAQVHELVEIRRFTRYKIGDD